MNLLKNAAFMVFKLGFCPGEKIAREKLSFVAIICHNHKLSLKWLDLTLFTTHFWYSVVSYTAVATWKLIELE